MQMQLNMKELKFEQYRVSRAKEETVSLGLPSVQNKFDVTKVHQVCSTFFDLNYTLKKTIEELSQLQEYKVIK
jgi:hypothetical protein